MAEFTNDDVVNRSPFLDKAEQRGFTDDYLLTRLKREFNAREPKTIKIKGAVKQEDLPKGYNIIATSGTLAYDKEGEQVFGDGETVIRYDPWNIGVQQGARKDFHKLRGDYPAEKVEHTVSLEDKLRAIHKNRDKED